jgi:hypothetical protein
MEEFKHYKLFIVKTGWFFRWNEREDLFAVKLKVVGQ